MILALVGHFEEGLEKLEERLVLIFLGNVVIPAGNFTLLEMLANLV